MHHKSSNVLPKVKVPINNVGRKMTSNSLSSIQKVPSMMASDVALADSSPRDILPFSKLDSGIGRSDLHLKSVSSLNLKL